VAHNIPLEGVFMEGSLPLTSYNVVLPNQTYSGEIKVGLPFTIKVDSIYAEALYIRNIFLNGNRMDSY